MAGRPTIKKADIAAIKQLNATAGSMVDLRPIIAFTMRSCGCTFDEIGEAFDVTRQMAKTLVDQAERLA
jgi:hypothetical protein